MRNANKKLNRNKNILTKIIAVGALVTLGASTLVYTNEVDAKALPAATTKDYNKLQKLSKQPGEHYIKAKKWYAGFTPGNNVQAFKTLNNYKLIGTRSNPGSDNWDQYIGAGLINGESYFIVNNKAKDGSNKYLIPAEYCKIPYAYKLKSNHKPVYDYAGSLANAYNGYSQYLNEYGHTLTKENIIYSNKSNGKYEVTLNADGKNTGKNQGFWIGKTPINFRVDGTDTYEDYYPLYNYDPDGQLTVSYIKVEDLDQFEPTTVTYDHIGTITNKHAFKPAHKKMDF